jgi:deoxyribodipyrimidine photo-lyase
LSSLPAPTHHPEAYWRWCEGTTGERIVDAGMRELAATGWISNRMRQIVASYLVHDLACDWRAGAAWFESQLIDHDVYSNQGNWLYVSGRGTDPRQGRRFNPQKQSQEHDPDGRYQARWLGD